jgi:preprotein translocase SecE subunit
VFAIHKPGQAKLSRNTAFLGGLFFIAWGSRSLLHLLPRAWASLGESWNELLMENVTADAAWRVDLLVIRSKVSPAFTIAALVLVVAGLAWYRAANGPRLADLFIDMEAELRKVSWPTFPDAWQSTLVVSGFTALVVVLIFVYDVAIKGVIDLLPMRGS